MTRRFVDLTTWSIYGMQYLAARALHHKPHRSRARSKQRSANPKHQKSENRHFWELNARSASQPRLLRIGLRLATHAVARHLSPASVLPQKRHKQDKTKANLCNNKSLTIILRQGRQKQATTKPNPKTNLDLTSLPPQTCHHWMTYFTRTTDTTTCVLCPALEKPAGERILPGVAAAECL